MSVKTSQKKEIKPKEQKQRPSAPVVRKKHNLNYSDSDYFQSVCDNKNKNLEDFKDLKSEQPISELNLSTEA